MGMYRPKTLEFGQTLIGASCLSMRRNPESVTVRRLTVLVSKVNERGTHSLSLEYKHVPVRIIRETSNRSEKSQLKGTALLFNFVIISRSDLMHSISMIHNGEPAKLTLNLGFSESIIPSIPISSPSLLNWIKPSQPSPLHYEL